MSPDGRRVLFTVAPGGRAGEHKDQAIWVADEHGGARPFTAGGAHDAHPRWSPDGRHILFTSDRAERGEHRLYLLDAGRGGEARPLGDLQGALAAPAWSPDSRTVAVLRREPETAEEKRRKEARDDAVVAGADPKPQRLWVVDADTGRARCLTYGPRQVWSFAWSPDGDHLAAVTTPTPEGDTAYGPGDLWLVPAAGGLPRRIAGFPSLPDDPTFVETPDGPAIALRANAHRADPSDAVWTVPVAGGEPRNVLPGYPGVVERVAPIAALPGSVALHTVEGTHGLLYRLDLADGALTPLTMAAFHGRGSASRPSLSADGERLAFVWSDGTTPEEVYVAERAGKPATVTTFGAAFHGRLGHGEVVRWRSDDGQEVEGLLTLPVGHRAGQRHPLVVEIHGGPAWQWEDRAMLSWHDWAQLLASHGYAVLLPNPRGSTGYGSAFQRRIQDDVGGGEAQDVVSGVRAMVERGVADPDRLGIGGWSWGGYLTAWITTQTAMFKAAIMGAGLVNIVSDHGTDDIPTFNTWLYPGQPYHHMDHYWERSPIRLASNVTTPTLILHGDADVRVHPGQGMEWYRALRTLGVPHEFVRYPREGHGIQERLHQLDLLRRVLAWYDRWLKA
jgi:dipeptidyl aminopeptidase/acylaminoacyl peptidase